MSVPLLESWSSSSASFRAGIPWMQNMLRPIVEAAGYRVIDDADDDKADVVIACIGEELPDSVNDKTIWLRTEPEAARQERRQHLSL